MAGRGSVLPSHMTKDFSRIPAPQIQRSVFNRQHAWKGTFDAGYLVPFLVQEILPGDTMSLSAHIFARLATMIFPIMDNIFLDTFYFFIPNRLVWDNWERFCGAQDDPDDDIDFEIPQIGEVEPGAHIQFEVGSIFDYMRLPVDVNITQADAPSALPLRMYNLIWNEWFRDQNLQNSAVVMRDDGPDDPSDVQYVLLKRGKRHDYFTSCLLAPQKGDGISIPLGTTAPVIGTGKALGLDGSLSDAYGLYINTAGSDLRVSSGALAQDVGSAPNTTNTGTNEVLGLSTDPAQSHVIADLSAATAATINDLRLAFATQQFLEADARGGTRYTESLKAHFRVSNGDERLQRPEYLGGGSQPVNVSAVAQTTPNAAPTALNALGVLGAYSNVQARSGFQKSFTEHGYVLGLVNVRSDITYQQGMDRHWSRRTRFDFYWPEFAHLGEQAVLNKEIFYASNGATANDVFGYQERWAEYRYERSAVTGLFRTAASGALDAWHLATNFSALPELDAAFIADSDVATNIDRVIAVSSEPQVLMDSFIQIRHARPMPVYSVPGLQRL